MQLSQEQQDIINAKTNTIVVANPGTGKTTTLAFKVLKLLDDGVNPDNILCITFTTKAKKEMFETIHCYGKGKFTDAKLLRVNIHTFHSYAHSYLVEKGLMSDKVVENDFLQFSILNSFERTHALNYSKKYIITDMVPNTASALAYIKTFGITPDDIDIQSASAILEENHTSTTYSVEEAKAFLEYFVQAYRDYEQSKADMDYSDMLLTFIKKFQGEKFEYVLVDEMQDMNGIETEIVRLVAKNLFLVGDPKQAIFGFQGGSIKNFTKFADSCNTVFLSANMRSTLQILDYSKSYFLRSVKDAAGFSKELDNFNSSKTGDMPQIIATAAPLSTILNIIEKNSEGTIGIITRTNVQIEEIAQFLDLNSIEYSTTSSPATTAAAKDEICRFLRGLLNDRPEDMILAAFTVFSPYTLKEAFEFSRAFKSDRVPDGIKLWKCDLQRRNLDNLFDEVILPISISRGPEWFTASISVKQKIDKYLTFDTLTLDGLLDYIMVGQESRIEQNTKSKITLTTVHKAKGRDFDVVIYVPSAAKRIRFVDGIAKSILISHGIGMWDELEEESLRADFVAFTRAKENLVVITDTKKIQNYHVEGLSELKLDDSVDESVPTRLNHRLSEAYSLFVAGKQSDAAALLQQQDPWLRDLITDYFENLDHLSYSSIKEDPYEFLQYDIVNIPHYSVGMEFGSDVHAAMRLVLGNPAEFDRIKNDKIKRAVQNGLDAINDLKRDYSGLELHHSEMQLDVPLGVMTEWDGEDMTFTGYIDTIFKHDNGYLIVDYKTDKKATYTSAHRKQIAAYRRMFAKFNDIPEEKIDCCIIYLALRGGINTDKVDRDTATVAAQSYTVFEKRLQKLLQWKQNPSLFIDALLNHNCTDTLFLAVRNMLDQKV